MVVGCEGVAMGEAGYALAWVVAAREGAGWAAVGCAAAAVGTGWVGAGA